jgi:transposase-like protein
MEREASPNEPKTLLEAVRYFADPDTAHAFFVQVRWPNGVKCPRCLSDAVAYMPKYRRWVCHAKHPKRQFSAKVGTIFEDSPLPLEKWLPAVWMIANDKNGISSYELHRALGVTQKSAWFMLHRIREAMRTGSFTRASGTIEVDETFIGGASQNMHKAERARRGIRRSPHASAKAIVLGMLERTSRGGRVRAKVIPDVKRTTLHREIREHVTSGSEIMTDAHAGYFGLGPDYVHETIDHLVAYVRGKVHTNGLENFWSLLKRCLFGTYVNVDPSHLARYVDEEAFRYNERDRTDGGRFMYALRGAPGRRLTYRALIAEPA